MDLPLLTPRLTGTKKVPTPPRTIQMVTGKGALGHPGAPTLKNKANVAYSLQSGRAMARGYLRAKATPALDIFRFLTALSA